MSLTGRKKYLLQMSDNGDDKRGQNEADRIPKLKTKGQLVTFYRNGDPHYKVSITLNIWGIFFTFSGIDCLTFQE